jgi:acyl-coenzyme A thioesterase PaaI-like protein
MIYKIVKQLKNSKMCLVCGTENPLGLNGRFYQTATDDIIGIFRAGEVHQGFPQRIHGGMIASILDEIIGRTQNIKDSQGWAVTVDLRVRYRKPLPLGVDLKVLGRMTKDSKRMFEGTAEIYLPDGSVGAEGWAKYFRGTPKELEEDDFKPEEWIVVIDEPIPEEIEI